MNESEHGAATSVKSRAPDPLPGAVEHTLALDPRPGLTRSDRARSIASRYALIGVWLVMAGIYGAAMPGKFLQVSTVQTIFGSQASLVFLALAALCTFVVGEFDLSFAAVMGLSATIIPVLSSLHHVPLVLACVIALAASIGCGCLNALFVVGLGVPSLIVTLGSASLFLGISELIFRIEHDLGHEHELLQHRVDQHHRAAARVLLRPRLMPVVRLRHHLDPDRPPHRVRRREP